MNTRDTDIPTHYKQLLTHTTHHLQAILQDTEKTTKSTYKIIRAEIEKKIDIPQEIIWYDSIRRLTGKRLKWNKLWTHTYSSYNTGKTSDTLYLILHNRIQTRVKCKGRRGHYNVTCKICKKQDETTMHMAAECPHAKAVWETFEPYYTKLLTFAFIPEEAALTANLQILDDKQKQKLKLLKTLSEIILHEIWSARCKCNHENITPNLNRSVKSIVTTFETIIITHFQNHVKNNTLDTFVKNFCIDNVICSINSEYNLELYLP